MGGKCASIFKFSAMCQIFAKSDHTVHFRKYSLPPSEEIWQKEVLKFSTSADLSVFILIDGANAIYQISGSAIELQRHYEWLNWLCLSEPLHSGWLKTKWMKRPLFKLDYSTFIYHYLPLCIFLNWVGKMVKWTIMRLCCLKLIGFGDKPGPIQ